MKKRVLVIGGGPSALSAAWALSNGPRANDIDVTVHTLGWRLGGKAATGRGPNGRIQEHGIHGFAGFYVNATNLLEDAYVKVYGPDHSSTKRQPVAGHGPRSIKDALIPDDYSIDFLFNDGKVIERPFWFQRNDGNPWDNNDLKLTRAQAIESVITLTTIAVLRRPIPRHSKRWRVVRAFSQASAWVS